MPTMKAVLLSTLAASAAATQATLTSVTPDNLVATATPTQVVYVFTPLALADTETFTITHNAQRYAANAAVACTVAGAGSSGTITCAATGVTGTILTCTLDTSAVVAAAANTVTCTSNIAVNNAAATETSTMVTTNDVDASTAADTIITDTGRATCAQITDAASGGAFACGGGFSAKANPATITCGATPCLTNTDVTQNAACCDADAAQATCAQITDGSAGGAFVCGAGFTIKGTPEGIDCGATPCLTNADATQKAACCDAVAAYAGEAGKWDKAGAATTCVAGDVALCTAHATLKVKKTADDLCPACNELTAAPAVTDAAGACMACPPYSVAGGVMTGHFPNAAATAGCGDCAADCMACTSATVCTEAHPGYFLKDGASPAVGVETCVAGDVALCTADATLKVLKSVDDLCPATMSSDGSWTGSPLTATPAVSTAAQACKACEVGTFPNVADTASCGNCAANCDECTSATVCTAASAGFFLKTTGEAVAPAACTAAADATLCTADATLKLAKTASDLCPAGNTLTATPAVAAAAGACKACALGNTPKDAATAGCAAVAGKCAGNAGSDTDLDQMNVNEGAGNTYHFDCGCPMKMVLKPSADTIALSGADAAAKKAVCCAAYVAPVTTTVAATTAAPAAPSPAAAAAAAAGTAPSSGSLSDATAASMSTMILLVAAGIAAATSL